MIKTIRVQIKQGTIVAFDTYLTQGGKHGVTSNPDATNDSWNGARYLNA